MGDFMAINSKILKNKEKISDYGLLDYHVLEGMADWVRVIDKSGYVIYANKSMKDDLGEEIIGKKCYETICNIEECANCITTKSMDKGEIFQKEEIINGNYYSVKSSPVRDSDGSIFAVVEVFRNVTRERKLEEDIIGKNRKMNRDLQFAKRIQEKILPQKGKVEGLSLDYIYKPSEMLSGDMFDMYNVDENHIGIYISDVAGNGVAASMMTMFIRQTMRVMKDDIVKPSKALKELHRRFLSLNFEAENYFTIFYGIYDKENRIFKYANAGHNCIPIKYNSQGLELLENKGFPISIILEEVDYQEKEIQLDLHDKILFYTDGVTEARDFSGREFGLEGVIEIIDKHPNDILNVMEDRIINYSWGEQIDDFAIVLLEVIG